jgi:hypothetical protein
VIALQDVAGTIYWSWHIWVVNYDPNTEKTWTNPNNTAYTFMDRNLGANEATLSLASHGLFYQWDRKDPFPSGTKGTAGYAALSHFKGMYTKQYGDPEHFTADDVLESIREPTDFISATRPSPIEGGYNSKREGNWLKNIILRFQWSPTWT